jgi:hypothetical protein
MDPLVAFANEIAPKFIVGKLLKFTKGDYFAGEENKPIPLGTRFIVGIDYLLNGWVRWQGGRPVEHRMAHVINGDRPQLRSDLGYQDESKWEVDNSGQLRDPWQITSYVPMVDEESGAVFTFSTASRGGRNAIADLCREYVKGRHDHPDDFPVVEVQCGSYKHQNSQFGRIKFPAFKLVSWTAKSSFGSALGLTENQEDQKAQEVQDEEIPF